MTRLFAKLVLPFFPSLTPFVLLLIYSIKKPFSFGGLYGTRSKYGDMDITGDGAMEFFSNRVKVTSKWPIVRNGKRGPSSSSRKRSRDGEEETSLKAQPAEEPKDAANFAGQM